MMRLIQVYGISLLLWLLLGGLIGCKATRYVEPGQIFLASDPTTKDNDKISDEAIYSAVRTQANRRMLFPRTALHTYNTARNLERIFGPNKPPLSATDEPKGGFQKLIRLLKYRWGEAPVLLDSALLEEDARRLQDALFAHGYFYPEVSYEVSFKPKAPKLRPKVPDSAQIARHQDRMQKWRAGKRKASVTYFLEEGVPYRIREVRVLTADSSEQSRYLAKVYQLNLNGKMWVRKGELYNHKLFERERERGAVAARNSGFLTFSSALIKFKVDTSLQENALPDSSREVPRQKWMDVDIQISQTPPLYTIKNTIVIVHPPAGAPPSPKVQLYGPDMSAEMRDSLGISPKMLREDVRIYFRVDSSYLHRINYNTIAERIALSNTQSGLYHQNEVDATQRSLQELGIVQYIVMGYKEVGRNQVELRINMYMAPQFRIKAGGELFTRDLTAQNATLLPSLGGNLALRNRNAFRSSELFELSTSGSLGILSSQAQGEEGAGSGAAASDLYYQLGASAKVTYPRFLFGNTIASMLRLFKPTRKLANNMVSYRPITELAASFSLENFGGEFVQVAPGARLVYQWRNHRKPYIDREKFTVQFSRFAPLVLTYIAPSLQVEVDQFLNTIPGETLRVSNSLSDLSQRVLSLPPLLYQDFSPRLSSRLQFGFTHQNYQATRAFPTFFYNVGLEWGGNLVSLLEGLAFRQGRDSVRTDNRLLNSITYGRYARATLEGKLFIPLGSDQEVVLRGAVGVALTLGNSQIVPREGRFFSGGLNGMRGWQSNALGPGRARWASDLGGQDLVLTDAEGQTTSLPASDIGLTSLTAPGGEYLLELNAEYRIDLIPALYLELALFTDLGNVWLSRSSALNLNPLQPEVVEKAVLSRQNLSLAWDAGVGFRFDLSFLVIRIDLGQPLYDPALQSWVSTLQVNPSLAIGYPF